MENTNLNEKKVPNLQNELSKDGENLKTTNENTPVGDNSALSNEKNQDGNAVADNSSESKPEPSVLEKVKKYYNVDEEKPRKNAIALMVFSMLAMVVSIVVGVYFAIKIGSIVFGFNSDALFDQTNNLKTFGLAGFSGVLLYVMGGVLIILLLAVTYIFASAYFKLFKNLKDTKCQPYCIVSQNGAMMFSLVKSMIFVALIISAVVISINSKINTISLVMLIVLASVCAVVMIDLLVELVVGRTSFSKLTDEGLKAEIKKEYKFSFFKKRVSDSDRAKNRKRWF